ncbi:ABC transporter permease [candidate division KSB1 bacterium]|nr:ABC transporter permease [candidate division KSB1 bacterium]
MLIHYFKVILRYFLKNKSYTLINLSGLSIGMACFILILLWVRDELSYDRFHQNANQICRVISVYGGSTSQCHPGPLANFLKNEIPEIKLATRLHDGKGIYQYEDKILRLQGLFVEPEFLDIFTFPPIAGEARQALNEPGSIVITEETAQKFFGKQDPIGKILKVDRQWTAKVAGVIQNVPKNSSLPLQFNYLAPFKIMYFDHLRHPDQWNADSDYNVFVLLNPNSSPAFVSDKIESLLRRYQIDRKWSLFLQPLTEVHLFSNFNLDSPHGSITYVLIFSGIAFLILCIACINYMNLATARSLTSVREVGIRKAVGANRWQLLPRFFGESLLLTSFAFGSALLLVHLLLPDFNNFIGKALHLDFADYQLSCLLVGIFVLTNLLAGIYPAIVQVAPGPVNTLKSIVFFGQNASRGPGQITRRKILVITQFAISIIVIIATMTIYFQLNYIQNKKIGFESENLIYVPAAWSYNESTFSSFRSQLLQHPAIVNVTNSDHLPNYDIVFRSTTYWFDGSQKKEANFRGLMVGFDFLDTYQMELAQGRFFSHEFSGDRTHAFIINEAAARAMQMVDPIGKELEMYDRKGSIIGVVKDFHFENMHQRIEPLVFSFTEHCMYLTIRVKGERLPETLNYIQAQTRAYFPVLPFEFHFWKDTLEQFYRTEWRMGQLFTCFSLLAIFISCLGILGLAAFVVARKTKEIGIRKVLGASAVELLVLLTGDFMKWILWANVIAWPVAFFGMESWLRHFAYRTTIGWWWSFAAAAIFSLLIALLTIGWEVLRAARTNPVESLRYE